MASTKMIQFLISDLLDYSQISQNKFRQNIKRFDLKKSIKEVMAMQRIKAESKGVQLIAEYEGLANPFVYHDEQRI